MLIPCLNSCRHWHWLLALSHEININTDFLWFLGRNAAPKSTNNSNVKVSLKNSFTQNAQSLCSTSLKRKAESSDSDSNSHASSSSESPRLGFGASTVHEQPSQQQRDQQQIKHEKTKLTKKQKLKMKQPKEQQQDQILPNQEFILFEVAKSTPAMNSFNALEMSAAKQQAQVKVDFVLKGQGL